MQNKLLRRGVFFLANDRVYEQTVAFLNSFRTYNKAELCLIPFDDQYSKIQTLQEKYKFDIFDDIATLEKCDKISKEFLGNVCGAFRKLAAWEGSYDEFIYIDTDTVVLKDVSFSFKSLEFADFVTSHSNIPAIRQWVWKDSIDEVQTLSQEQTSFAANTGFIVSKKDSLRLADVSVRIDDALRYKQHMQLLCMEQPLLNFLFVTSGKKYNSLSNINTTKNKSIFPLEYWAGAEGAIVMSGQLFSTRYPRSYFLVHWAGEWAGRSQPEEIPYYDLWKYYRYKEEL